MIHKQRTTTPGGHIIYYTKHLFILPIVVIMTAACMALLGLTFTCPGGIHMFTLFNESAPSWNLLLFALLEVILISWAYGADKFLDHLEDMIPHFSRIAKVISI